MVDIEADTLSQATRGIGHAQTMGAVCDVSDEVAVNPSAEQVMAKWGGGGRLGEQRRRPLVCHARPRNGETPWPPT
jgi:hypothetical protein